jgi:LacI family transcriptional regulator
VQKPPTLTDVARRAGVHPATASRALNPETRELVNGKTVRRVVAAARELGYSPNVIARALRTAKTATTGVILPDLTNPIFPPMVRGIEDALLEDGHTPLLADTDNDEDKEEQAVRALQSRQVDGLLIATARRRHPLLRQLAAGDLPIVLISRFPDDSPIPAVVADDATGITEAFDHLWALGHRRIGHLAGPLDLSTSADRARAFEYSAASAGVLETSPVIECGRFTQKAGAHAMDRLLSVRPDITGVIAGNDLIALGAIETLSGVGKRCPDDVSIIGFNDMPFLDMMAPPLTTVRVSHYDMGFEAARMLIDILQRPTAKGKGRIVLPTRLVVRRSTVPPPDHEGR